VPFTELAGAVRSAAMRGLGRGAYSVVGTISGGGTEVGVVAGVTNKLIKGEPRRRRWRIAVARFKTLFQTGIGQMAIADENTQATGIQKRDVDIAVGPAGAGEDAG